MVTFDFRYFAFEHGLRMLEKGYIAARDALQAEIESIEAKARAYEESIANGGEWIGEYEDGHTLWDQSQVYDVEISDVYEALLELRKALVIALYHHWERSAAGWRGSFASHDELVTFSTSIGCSPSPNLDAIRYLANHLKHGPNARRNWLTEMRVKYPSFLPPGPTALFGLSDEDLAMIGSGILASGPKP